MCNIWRYGHKLPNTHAHGIDEHYFDFHLRAQFLQPTTCLLLAYIMCHSEMLALQFSLVLPGAVRPHEDVVVGLPTSQLGRCAFVTYKNKISDYYSGIIFQEPP